MTIEFLLRRAAATGDARALAIARRSLDRMADGGIRDQLGGGFHRYATDERWLVPHFEQMLYDNAQLARVYLHAWALTRDPRYREVAMATLDYVLRELTTADGAFASSQDADTDGVEGGTFTWRVGEIRDLLGEDAPLFETAYGVTEGGNWEGVSILSRVRATPELAQEYGLTPIEVERRLAVSRDRLLAARAKRSQPARDDKALAAWNGLAIAALADGARLLGLAADLATGEAAPALFGEAAERYRAAAERAAEAILAGLFVGDGRLARSWKDGRATGQGVLEDYACLADGLLALYEATFDERWFRTARSLTDRILAHFVDPDGGFHDTADDHERLVTRPKDVQDNATPSGNAMTAFVLLRLAALTGEGRYRDAAERAIATITPFTARHPTAFAMWLQAIDLSLADIVEVAIVGAPDEEATRDLLAVVGGGYTPSQVVALAADPAASEVPLLRDRTRVRGKPAAYVCRGFTCDVPATDPDALREQLREHAAAL